MIERKNSNNSFYRIPYNVFSYNYDFRNTNTIVLFFNLKTNLY